MPAKVPSKAALRCTDWLREILRELPHPWTDRAAYQAALATLQTKILHEGGSFTADSLGARVRLHGFKATSTMGLAAACHNWITQVTLKAATASMAGTA
jgi:hypothetical protein